MITPRFSRFAAVLGLALALAACAAPAAYAPRRPGETTGYTDRELAPGRYRVTFTGNSVTTRDTVQDFLLLRAAEVTLAAGGTHFVFDDRDNKRPHHLSQQSGLLRPRLLWAGRIWRLGLPAALGLWPLRPAADDFPDHAL